jgi:hypothetical protein
MEFETQPVDSLDHTALSRKLNLEIFDFQRDLGRKRRCHLVYCHLVKPSAEASLQPRSWVESIPQRVAKNVQTRDGREN